MSSYHNLTLTKFLVNTGKQKMREEKNYKEKKNKIVTKEIMLVRDDGCRVS